MWCAEKIDVVFFSKNAADGNFHCTVQLCTSVQHVYSMCTLTDDFSSLKMSRQFYGKGGGDGKRSCLKQIDM